MDIKFTNHFVERKTERDDYLLSTKRYSETRKNKTRTERLLRERGRWYSKYDREEGITRLYCIVNNLEVYCAVMIDDPMDPYILITTYFPYTSKVKRKLFPKGIEIGSIYEIQDLSPKEVRIIIKLNADPLSSTYFGVLH